MRTAKARSKKSAAKRPAKERRCALCGATGGLTRTECCDRWICDDEGGYVMFSYARNSCSRNHRRYTLCGSHHAEGHAGRWPECAACRENFVTELYVYFGTNEYNFAKLENPPAFEPTKCVGCQCRIRLGLDGYSLTAEGYFCEHCAEARRASRPMPSRLT